MFLKYEQSLVVMQGTLTSRLRKFGVAVTPTESQNSLLQTELHCVV